MGKCARNLNRGQAGQRRVRASEIDAENSASVHGIESNLRDRVLSEVLEKNSFIALPGKGGHSGLVPLKTVCPNLGGFGEEFYSNGSRAGLLIRIRVCAGPALL